MSDPDSTSAQSQPSPTDVQSQLTPTDVQSQPSPTEAVLSRWVVNAQRASDPEALIMILNVAEDRKIPLASLSQQPTNTPI